MLSQGSVIVVYQNGILDDNKTEDVKEYNAGS